MVKDIFSKDLEADLEDRHAYLNVKWSGLYRFTCRYPTFPCAYFITWIVSHIDEKTMTLININGKNLATFLAEDYQHMYHLPEPVNLMESYFYATHNSWSTKYIIKGLVKDPSKFWYIPTHSYETKSLRKAYQILAILACKIYGK